MVETGGLENRCTGNRTGGSNPSLSASFLRGPSLRSGFRLRARTPADRLKFESLPLRQKSSRSFPVGYAQGEDFGFRSLSLASLGLTPAKRLKFESLPLRS